MPGEVEALFPAGKVKKKRLLPGNLFHYDRRRGGERGGKCF